MKVWDYLAERLKRGEKLHMTLLDPEKISPRRAGELARIVERVGSCAIMVGGSTGDSLKIDETVKEIKIRSSLPVILFPSSASFLSRYADAVYFMSLLNSKSIRYLTGEQLKGVPYIRRYGIEPIPMGYIIVGPGEKVGEVGRVKLIPRNRVREAASYGLLAQYMGMRLVYLEAGSGAREPVPWDMIREVKKNIDIPLVVGGGIRSPPVAQEVVGAGADIVVTGELVEKVENVEEVLGEIIEAIKSSKALSG
jgi:phosphoglycerol geranylgeranyltransferase